MTSAGPCGVWVASNADPEAADGTLPRPFVSFEAALAKARPEGKIVCALEGTFNLGHSTLIFRDQDKIFGSFRPDSAGSAARPEDFAMLRGTILQNDGLLPLVRFEKDVAMGTELNGLTLRQDPAVPNFTSEPLVLVDGARGVAIRQNNIESREVRAYARGDVLTRIGILVRNTDVTRGVRIESNLIRIGDVFAEYGAAVGIQLAGEKTHELSAWILENRIEIGTANLLTAGILGYAEQADNLLKVTIEDNKIRFGQAKKSVFFRETDYAYVPGGHSVGIAFGAKLKAYPLLSEYRVGNWSVFEAKYYDYLMVQRNDIHGDAVNPSYISSAVRLTGGAYRTDLYNNYLAAGQGKILSSALHLEKGQIQAYHNTLIGGGVSLPRTVRHVNAPRFLWEPEYIETRTYARSCGAYSVYSDHLTRVDLNANIFTSQVGVGDNYGLCAFGLSPFEQITSNLFDDKLFAAYYQGTATDG